MYYQNAQFRKRFDTEEKEETSRIIS
jgi:hypothetical protein